MECKEMLQSKVGVCWYAVQIFLVQAGRCFYVVPAPKTQRKNTGIRANSGLAETQRNCIAHGFYPLRSRKIDEPGMSVLWSPEQNFI